MSDVSEARITGFGWCWRLCSQRHRHYRNPMEQGHRDSRRVAIIGLIGTLILFTAKLVLWGVTDSSAVLADALESLANVAASVMALFAVWYASRPPDREHPYGHGNIEFVAAATEGLMVVAAGLVIAAQSIIRLVRGGQVMAIDTGLIGLAAICVGLVLLGSYMFRRGKALHSEALAADGRHLLIDAVSTLAVMAALVVVRFTGWQWLDPVAAIVICLIALSVGGRLIWRGVHGLLDRVDEDDLAEVEAILDHEVAAGHIVSYEKVRLRHHGADHWVDMHLRFPPETTVAHAHAIASAIEGRIEKRFGPGNATAHLEPAG